MLFFVVNIQLVFHGKLVVEVEVEFAVNPSLPLPLPSSLLPFLGASCATFGFSRKDFQSQSSSFAGLRPGLMITYDDDGEHDEDEDDDDGSDKEDDY